eukprot:GSChrysophyteH1.ASY1.ANO1.3350.1 assembled CDS
MKLTIDLLVTQPPTECVKNLRARLLEATTTSVLCTALDEIDLEKYSIDEIDDLRHWVPVLSRLDDLLSKWCPSIPLAKFASPVDGKVDMVSYASILNTDDGLSPKQIICSTLNFLWKLLKLTTEKRCFLSYEHIGTLLGAVDLEIVELACKLLFYLTIPTVSAASYSPQELDLRDSIEVPDSVANKALDLFEGLGMMCPNYTILDFVRGHSPDGMGAMDEKVTIRFPSKKTPTKLQVAGSSTDLQDVELSLVGDGVAPIMLQASNTDEKDKIIQTHLTTLSGDSNSEFNMSLLAYLWALESLRHGDMNTRLRIITLRLHCFYILIHSHIQHTKLLPYVKTPSGFHILRDLVAISDVCSYAVEEMQLKEPYHLGKLALECLTGILEASTRRRGIVFDRMEVFNEIGLRKPMATTSGSDSAWAAIVITACSVAGVFLDGRNDESQKSDRVDALTYATYVRSGLELFINAVQTREVADAVLDAPVVGAIVGFLQASLPIVTEILIRGNDFVQANPGKTTVLSKWDTQIVCTVNKGFVCLSMCIQYGYGQVLRECDGLSLLTAFIELYADRWSESLSFLEKNLKNTLDSVLDITSDVIDLSRRNAFGETDNGVQLIHQPCFAVICGKIFSVPFYDNEYLWIDLLTLLKEAIVSEPTFLGVVLRSEYIGSFSVMLKRLSSDDGFLSSPSKISALLIPLAKLSYSMCITADGQQFVVDNHIPKFIVETLVNSKVLLPSSEGLTSDSLEQCSASLSRIMRESENMVEEIRGLIQTTLMGVCQEAQDIWSTTEVSEMTAADIGSERMQVVQKLSNICCFVECLVNPTYHSKAHKNNDMLRQILSEDLLEGLVRAYPCTLPPITQLMSQLCVRQQGTMTHCGYHPTARAITSLLKLAAGITPQSMLPVIFKVVDESLTAVSTAKGALRMAAVSLDSPLTPSVASGITAESAKMDAVKEVKAPPDRHQRQRRRSRGSSLGGEGANVLVLGILDSVPHLCFFDPELAKPKNCNNELRLFMWKFIIPIVTLEWHSMMMSYCLRPMQRNPNPSANVIANGKNVLRRLFAFHRSSILEICRFSSSKWNQRTLAESRAKRTGLLDVFASCDSSDDLTPILRTPKKYVLRVISPNGAIIREDCEFENSRIVLLAAKGTICEAYERSMTSGGVVRYRTKHGWLSEYRRDHQRDPIVEILECVYEDVPEDVAQLKKVERKMRDPKLKRLAEALTMRETVCYSMTRIHATLRQVGVYLSRAIMCESGDVRRTFSNSRSQMPSPSAPLLSQSLSKIFKGFLKAPFSSLDEASQSIHLRLVRDGIIKIYDDDEESPRSAEEDKEREVKEKKTHRSRSRSPAPTGVATDSSMKTPNKEGWSKRDMVKKPDSSGKPPRAMSRSTSKDNLVDTKDNLVDTKDDDAKGVEKELVPVDSAAMCLYQGAVVKFIIVPAIDDRNGSLNTYLLRTLMHFGSIDALLKAFSYLICVLHDSLNKFYADGADVKVSKDDKLGAAGCCALNAIPGFLQLFHKLVHKDAIATSPVTAAMAGLVDDIGTFQVTDLVRSVLMSISSFFAPIFANNDRIFSNFPTDIKRDWLLLIGQLLKSLRQTLPGVSLGPERALNSSRTDAHNNESAGIRGVAIARDREGVHTPAWVRRQTGLSSDTPDSAGPEVLQVQTSPIHGLSDDTMTQLTSLMTFTRPQVFMAARETGSTDVDELLAWLATHPWQLEENNPVSPILATESDVPGNLDETYIGSISIGANDDASSARQILDDPVSDNDDASGSPITGAGAAQILEAGTMTDEEANASSPAASINSDIIRSTTASPFTQTERNQLVQTVVDALASPQEHDEGSGSVQAIIDLLPSSVTSDINAESIAAAGSGITPTSIRNNGIATTHRSGISESNSAERPVTARSYNRNESTSYKKTNNKMKVDKTIAELQKLATKLDLDLLKNIVGITEPNIDDWRFKDDMPREFTSIQEICAFFVHFIEETQTTVHYVGLLSQLASKIEAISIGGASIDPSESDGGLYDLVHFLFCLLRQSQVKSSIRGFLNQEFVSKLITNLISLLSTCIESRNKSETRSLWPSWFAPALLILSDLMDSPGQHIPSAPEKSANDDESEGEKADDIDKLIQSIKETNSLVNETDRRAIFNVLTTLVASDPPNPPTVHIGVTCDVCGTGPIKGTRYKCRVRDDYDLCSDCYAVRDDDYEMREILFPINYGALTVNPVCTDVYQGVFNTLTLLLTDHSIADDFVFNGGLENLLKLPNYCYVEEHFVPVFSLIIQRCTETRVELRQDMARTIRNYWRAYKDKKKNGEMLDALGYYSEGLPLKTFFSECGLAMRKRSFDDFVVVMKATVAFTTPLNFSSSVQTDIRVSLLSRTHSEQLYNNMLTSLMLEYNDLDARAMKTLQVLMSALTSFYLKVDEETAKSSRDVDEVGVTAMTPEHILAAVADCMLTLRRTSQLIGKGCFNMKSSNLVDFIIERIFAEEARFQGAGTLQAAGRLLLVLCSLKGAPRKMVLSSLVTSLKFQSITERTYDENSEAADKFLRVLMSVAKTLSIVMRATQPDKITPNKGDLQVSVETVRFMMEQNIPLLLTEALESIPIDDDAAAETIDSILEPLEILLRPALQANFSNSIKVGQSSSENVSEAASPQELSRRSSRGQAWHTAEADVEPVLNAARDEDTPSVQIEITEESAGDSRNMEETLHSDDEYFDDDDDDGDEYEEDDDAEGDEVDYDDVSESTGGVGPDWDFDMQTSDDEGDNTMQISRPAAAEAAAAIQSVLDAPYEGDHAMTQNLISAQSLGMTPMPAFSGSGGLGAATGFRMDNDRMGAGGMYSTPPDQIREDPLNFVLSSLGGIAQPDSPEAMFVDLLRNSVISGRARVMSEPFGSSRRDASRRLLPGGINEALQVRRPEQPLVHNLMHSNFARVDLGNTRDNQTDMEIERWERAMPPRVMDHSAPLSPRETLPPHFRTLTRDRDHRRAAREARDNSSNTDSDQMDFSRFIELIRATQGVGRFDDERMESSLIYRCGHQGCEQLFETTEERDNHAGTCEHRPENRADVVEAITPTIISHSDAADSSADVQPAGDTNNEDGAEAPADEADAADAVDAVDEVAGEPAAEAESVDASSQNDGGGLVGQEEAVSAAELVGETAFSDSPAQPDLIDEAALALSMQQVAEPEAAAATANDTPSESATEDVAAAMVGDSGLTCPPGYDTDVFFSLPEDMQREIIAQSTTMGTSSSADDQTRELAANAGYDWDTFMSLPEDIRQELLEQARREQASSNASAAAPAADPANAEDMDNASFLASLPPELRAEVLMTAEPDFLESLPPEFIAEAQLHRERAHDDHPSHGNDGNDESTSDEDSDFGAPQTMRTDGFMTVPVDETDSQNLLQNIGRHAGLRDHLLRTLTYILSCDQSRLDKCLRESECSLNLADENKRINDASSAHGEVDTSQTPKTLINRILVALTSLTGDGVNEDNDKQDEKDQAAAGDSGDGTSVGGDLTLLPPLTPLKDVIASPHSLLNDGLSTCSLLETYVRQLRNESEKTKTRKPKKGEVLVQVPEVSLSRDSLNALCSVLQSDKCAGPTFDNVIASISDLSRIKNNQVIITTLLIEVIGEIGEESRMRLCDLRDTLHSIEGTFKKKNEIQDTEDGRAYHIPASLLPIGKAGGKQHERFLRSMQTLNAVASKSGIIDIASSNILTEVWSSLEAVMTHLRRYLAEDDDEKTDISAAQASTKVRAQSALTSLVSRLLPILESFFLVHTSSIDMDPETTTKLPGQNAEMSSLMSRSYRLQGFILEHKGILNLLVTSKPSLLDNSFSVIMRVPQLRSSLNFENKRKYFFAQLKNLRTNELQGRRMRGGPHLQLVRTSVFEDSFHQLRFRTPDEMRGRMQINFRGEEGIDAGGVTREWYIILSREIFNPNYALFTAAADGATFQPNPMSNVNTNHLDYFKFVGRVIGKAICDEHLMDAHFTRSFYKHMLGIPVDYIDIEAIEPDYFKSLKMILDMPLEDLGLELNFSAESTIFGKRQVVDLVPNGRNIEVTDENKMEYIQLISHHRMTSAIRGQIESFLDGFYDLLLLCGLPDVDLDDLYSNTEYSGYAERAQFLQFVTGTSKVPLDGFANLQGMRGAQKFSIHRVFGDTGLLPQAHTCFNQLDLPAYTTANELREKLLMAIKEGSEGFGFA